MPEVERRFVTATSPSERLEARCVSYLADKAAQRRVYGDSIDSYCQEEAKADSEDIELRMFPVVNEALALLDEELGSSPEDIDAVFVDKLGFPSSLGSGPCAWADEVGLWYVEQRLREDTTLEPTPALTAVVYEVRSRTGNDAQVSDLVWKRDQRDPSVCQQVVHATPAAEVTEKEMPQPSAPPASQVYATQASVPRLQRKHKKHPLLLIRFLWSLKPVRKIIYTVLLLTLLTVRVGTQPDARYAIPPLHMLSWLCYALVECLLWRVAILLDARHGY